MSDNWITAVWPEKTSFHVHTQVYGNEDWDSMLAYRTKVGEVTVCIMSEHGGTAVYIGPVMWTEPAIYTAEETIDETLPKIPGILAAWMMSQT